MCFVVMTQPAFPGIYPPDPPVVGHALLVNKDFVEMLALLVDRRDGGGTLGRAGLLPLPLGSSTRSLLAQSRQKAQQ